MFLREELHLIAIYAELAESPTSSKLLSYWHLKRAEQREGLQRPITMYIVTKFIITEQALDFRCYRVESGIGTYVEANAYKA